MLIKAQITRVPQNNNKLSKNVQLSKDSNCSVIMPEMTWGGVIVKLRQKKIMRTSK